MFSFHVLQGSPNEHVALLFIAFLQRTAEMRPETVGKDLCRAFCRHSSRSEKEVTFGGRELLSKASRMVLKHTSCFILGYYWCFENSQRSGIDSCACGCLTTCQKVVAVGARKHLERHLEEV